MAEKPMRLKKLPPEISDQLAQNLGEPFRRIDMLPRAGGATVGFKDAIRRDAQRLGLVAEKRGTHKPDYLYRLPRPGEKAGLVIIS
jgi:hypothetical protein